MTYMVRPLDKAQDKAVKAVLDALKVPYEKTEEKSPYNPEFVEKILQGAQDIKNGKGVKIDVKELWK